MKKEIFGSIYIQFLSIGIRNIPGNGNDIDIAEPVTIDFQLSGLWINRKPAYKLLWATSLSEQEKPIHPRSRYSA